ncbi:hypothetical protein HK096_002021, partial [Nowakowskiella sp. JEL0078]
MATRNSVLVLDPTPLFEDDIVVRLRAVKDSLLKHLSSDHGHLFVKDDETLWTKVLVLLKELHALRNLNNVLDKSYSEADLLLEEIAPMFVSFWSLNGAISLDLSSLYIEMSKELSSLDDLNKSGLFISRDIEGHRSKLLNIDSRLHELILLNAGETQVSTADQSSLTSVRLLKSLNVQLESIARELHPIRTRLVEIQLQLHSLLTRTQNHPHAFSLSEIQVIQDELREIDSARIDGAFVSRDDEIIAGQAAIIQLMEQCFEDSHELLASRDTVTGENPLREVYERLVKLKGNLEMMEIAPIWTPREDETLLSIQIELGSIDDLRIDGKFLDPNDSTIVPPGQAVLHQVLHKCYRLVHKLQVNREPIAVELSGIRNQLETLKRCLEQLGKWKVELDDTELIPYQLKIASIDNMRVDGKFTVNGLVPEGQGILHVLINECYELLGELKCQMDIAVKFSNIHGNSKMENFIISYWILCALSHFFLSVFGRRKHHAFGWFGFSARNIEAASDSEQGNDQYDGEHEVQSIPQSVSPQPIICPPGVLDGLVALNSDSLQNAFLLKISSHLEALVQNKVSALLLRFNQLEVTSDTFTSQLDSLHGKHSELSDNCDIFSSSLSSVEFRLSAVDTALEKLNHLFTRIEFLESAVINNSAGISQLRNDQAELSSKVNKFSIEKINDIKTIVDISKTTIETKITNLEEQYSILSNSVTTKVENVFSMVDTVEKTYIAEHRCMTDAIEKYTETNETQRLLLEARINTLENQISEYPAAVPNKFVNIDVYDIKIKDIETSIIHLSETHATDIQTLQDFFNDNQRFADLEEKYTHLTRSHEALETISKTQTVEIERTFHATAQLETSLKFGLQTIETAQTEWQTSFKNLETAHVTNLRLLMDSAASNTKLTALEHQMSQSHSNLKSQLAHIESTAVARLSALETTTTETSKVTAKATTQIADLAAKADNQTTRLNVLETTTSSHMFEISRLQEATKTVVNPTERYTLQQRVQKLEARDSNRLST